MNFSQSFAFCWVNSSLFKRYVIDKVLASIQHGPHGIVWFEIWSCWQVVPPNTDYFKIGIPLVSEQGILDVGSLDSIQRLVYWIS
jgi:hypothetical protein